VTFVVQLGELEAMHLLGTALRAWDLSPTILMIQTMISKSAYILDLITFPAGSFNCIHSQCLILIILMQISVIETREIGILYSTVTRERLGNDESKGEANQDT
jgi:hypothetical protein